MDRLIKRLAGELRAVKAEVFEKYRDAEHTFETTTAINDEINGRINDRIHEVIAANALDIKPKKMLSLVFRGIPFDENLAALTRRGIRFTRIDKAASIKGAWTRLFTRDIPAEDLKAVYYDSYRWHIYSNEKADCLSGEDARRAFDEIEKSTLYLFFQNAAYGYKVENAHLLESDDLDWQNDEEHSDAYIFDPESGWTYVRPHEKDLCGPYYANIN